MHDERGSSEIVVESLGERLRAFPFFAIIAFAARFVRRVEPLTEGLPPHLQGPFNLAAFVAEQFATDHREALRATWAAIEVADAVSEAAWAVEAEGTGDAPKGAGRALMAAEAAVRAVKAAVEVHETGSSAGPLLATEAATWAARTASLAVVAVAESAGTPDEVITAAVVSDLDHLESMVLDAPGTFGKPIDPSDRGHLGPLWPDGAPRWFTDPGSFGQPTQPPPSAVAVDPSARCELLIEIVATEAVHDRDFIRMVGQLVSRANEIHKGLNGNGLQVDFADVDDGSFLTAEVSRG